MMPIYGQKVVIIRHPYVTACGILGCHGYKKAIFDGNSLKMSVPNKITVTHIN